jgi:hypothetical protein
MARSVWEDWAIALRTFAWFSVVASPYLWVDLSALQYPQVRNVWTLATPVASMAVSPPARPEWGVMNS